MSAAVCCRIPEESFPGLLLLGQARVLGSEAAHLRALCHPHLVACLDVRPDAQGAVLALVLEYLAGGELLDHLHLMHHYSEPQAALLFRQARALCMAWVQLSNA